jgi:exosortase
MNTVALADTASTDAPRAAGWRWLALGAAGAYLALLFAVWPYQHWEFQRRGSVLEGWIRVLLLDKHADWIFCLAVPLVSGWLVYRERARLRLLPLEGSWWGAPVLLVAISCYWAGYKVDTGYLGFAALQLSVAGLVLLLAGKAWMRAVFLAWVFLAFAWPFFPLDNLLAARLKIPTAQVAGQILSLTGVDVVREGSTLVSAANPLTHLAQGQRFRLDVSDDCSGMRSLYALITAAVLYAIIALRGVWPRLILAASAVPLAVIGNVVRLLLLAWGSLMFGQDFAVGRMVGEQEESSAFHLLAGFLVFAVALAGMFGLTAFLESRMNKKRPASGDPERTGTVAAASGSSTGWKSTFALGLAGTAMFLCWASPTSATLASPGISLALPSLVGDFPSEEMTMTTKESSVFEPGVELIRRRYFSPGGRAIIATVVLSGTAKKTLHTPESCLPDAGWSIGRREVVTVTLADGRKIDASLMHIFREARLDDGSVIRLRALHLYWYHGSHGVTTPYYDMHNFITYRDAIFRDLNHRWCQVSFYTVLPPGATGVDGMEGEMEMAVKTELVRFAGQAGDALVKR